MREPTACCRAIALAAVLSGGCATARTDGAEVTPLIAISPRAAERLAQMSRFRHHDRPRARVTVEEASDDEVEALRDGGAAAASGDDAEEHDE